MKLKIIYSKREDGIMSDDKTFYPNLSEEERKNKFELNKKNFLQKHNLDNVNILIPVQKTIYEEQDETFNYKDGTYEILTKENVTKYLKGEKYFHDDFLIIDSSIKNILVADKVADCPMLILLAKINEENWMLAIAHCGGEYINRLLPQQMLSALVKESNVDSKNIEAYLTPCISKESYVYDKYPPVATNKDAWKNAIEKRENLYYIDLREATINQLLEKGLKKENITVSNKDTRTDDDFYSHVAYKKGDISKNGRFIVGAVFLD